MKEKTFLHYLLIFLSTLAMVSCIGDPDSKNLAATREVHPGFPPNLVPDEAVIQDSLAFYLSLDQTEYQIGEDMFATAEFINVDTQKEIYIFKYFLSPTLHFQVTKNGKNLLPEIASQNFNRMGPFRFVALWPYETLSHTKWLFSSEFITEPGDYSIQVTYSNDMDPAPDDYTNSLGVVTTWHGTILSNVVIVKFK